MKKNICFLAKTNLKFDGRILAELNCLAKVYKDATINILLLSDGESEVDVPENVNIHEIKLFTRSVSSNLFMQFFSQIIYAFKQFKLLRKIKPDVIHVHDVFSVLGPLMYIKSGNRKCKVVYDDHELLNLKPSIKHKYFNWIEQEMVGLASVIFTQNRFRKRILNAIYDIDKIEIIKNYFYKSNTDTNRQLIDLKVNDLRFSTKKVLLHQGRIMEGRGSKELVQIARDLPKDWLLYFVGEKEEVVNEWLSDHGLNDTDKFIIEGYVPYENLQDVWKSVDGTIIMYNTKSINNKYCAPNRLYLALFHKVPIMSNYDNPVLYDYNKKYKIGFSFNLDKKDHLLFFQEFELYKNNYNVINEKFSFADTECGKIINSYDSLK